MNRRIPMLAGIVSFSFLCAMVAGCGCERSAPPTPDVSRNEGTKDSVPVVTTNLVRRSLTRKPHEPESTKRLAKGPQEISTTFQATGRGVWKGYGGQASGRYVLTSFVKAVSTIDAVREETARGNFEVTEIRKFTEVRDQLTVSETDIGLALNETLPLDVVSQCATGIGALIGLFNPAAGATTIAVTETVNEAIQSIDGNSLRGLLGNLGVEIPADIEAWCKELSNDYANGQLKDIRNKVHAIEGKSYRIVYLQDKEGAPLRVDFTNVDGSPIEEDEWDILKLANVFIDAQIIPDKRVQPGEKWEVDAATLAALVDPVAQGGSCEGRILIERKDDLPNGNWNLHFLPARIETKSDGGATVGIFRIADGRAEGDAENAFVKSLQVVGKGRLGRVKSNRWIIFEIMTKTETDCEFRAIMTTNRTK